MEEPNEIKEPPQVCSIRIAFPVKSDDEALAAKKKIVVALDGILDVQFNFSISTMPPIHR